MVPSPAAPPRRASIDARLASALRSVVGDDGVITDPGRLLPYESDALTAYRHLPGAVVLPRDTGEAARVVTKLHEAGVAVVPRGAGTGLSGGALALDGAVVVGTARMKRILRIDPGSRTARVQAGVPNLALSEATRPRGLHYAPDPSSWTACTLGGNVAENSGGPHCLKWGVTSRYVTGLTLVLPDGEVVRLGGAAREPTGYDLVGVVVGSEGCFGLVTEIEVTLLPVPEDVRTLLAVFDEVEDAGRAVTRIVASGLLPAALEIVDRETIRAVEGGGFSSGYPTDAGAALVVEFDGLRAGLDEQAEAASEACASEGAREVRRAASAEEREALWRGRKKAFGAMGRIAPDLMVQDATVPRSRLPAVLGRIREIGDRHGLRVANVFHAGDGNLHPNILFDRRNGEELERVERASKEIMRVCVDAGGTITGEHGVGLDKRAYMPLVHGAEELAAMADVKAVFDPDGRFNPGKVLPDGVRPAEERRGAAGRPTGAPRRTDPPELVRRLLGDDGLAVDPARWRVGGRVPAAVALPATAEEAGAVLRAASEAGVRTLVAGGGSRLGGSAGHDVPELVVSAVRMERVVEYEPADLTLTAGAGAGLDALARVTAEHGQWLPVEPGAVPGTDGPSPTLGSTLALGGRGPLSTLYGGVRDLALGLTLVTGDGRVLRLGGRVVKNVAGFDMVRLAVGSRGTLGLVTEATVRLYPRPAAVARLRAEADGAAALAGAARVAAGAPVVPARVELGEVTEGDGGRRGWLEVELHGSPGEVEASARRLRSAVPELVEAAGDGLGSAEAASTGAGSDGLSLRLRLPAGELGELVRLVGEASLPAGAGGAGGASRLRVDALRGVGWVDVNGVDLSGAGEAWRRGLRSLRSALEERGGGLTVVAAPPGLTGDVAAGPAAPPAEAALHGAIRARFDPAGILAAGTAPFPGAG